MYFYYSYSYFVLECQGPDLPKNYLIQKSLHVKGWFSVKMVLHDYPELRYEVSRMSVSQIEEVQIPVPGQKPGQKRILRARFYYPPELRREEFIEFPLVLHV